VIDDRRRPLKFVAGDIVFLEGSRAEKFYIVSGGAVELWKDYGEPHRDLLATHRKGGIFGEMALVDDLPRSATVVASRQTILLCVKREDFQRIIQEDSFIALSIMKGLSSIVRKSNEAFMGSLRERNRQLELANSEGAMLDAREQLTRMMGPWEHLTDYRLPEQLPDIPAPTMPPEPAWMEPMAVQPGYVAPPTPQSTSAPLIAGIGQAAGTLASIDWNVKKTAQEQYDPTKRLGIGAQIFNG